MKKLNTIVIDTTSGYIIDKSDIGLHNEKNKDSGERMLFIGQGDKHVAGLTFKVDEDGNASDFKTLNIIDRHDGMTLMKDDE